MSESVSEVMISREEIACKIKELGKMITEKYKGRTLKGICVLKGAVVFFADLIREINTDVRLDFIQVSSYGGSTVSTGNVKIIKDLDSDIRGENVLIIEDILDTGLTLDHLKRELAKRGPESVQICCLFDKPSRRKAEIKADYTGFEVADEFIVGYGLDYDGKYRNLKDICILQP